MSGTEQRASGRVALCPTVWTLYSGNLRFFHHHCNNATTLANQLNRLHIHQVGLSSLYSICCSLQPETDGESDQ